MKYILLIISVAFLTACSVEPGSEEWCEMKAEQSKSDWTASDARTYTMKCIIDGTAIGSEKWCQKLSEKPKGDWTGDEATSYAKHCVL